MDNQQDIGSFAELKRIKLWSIARVNSGASSKMTIYFQFYKQKILIARFPCGLHIPQTSVCIQLSISYTTEDESSNIHHNQLFGLLV